MYIYTYTLYIYIYIHVHVYVDIYAHMCVYIYIYIYMAVYTFKTNNDITSYEPILKITDMCVHSNSACMTLHIKAAHPIAPVHCEPIREEQ